MQPATKLGTSNGTSGTSAAAAASSVDSLLSLTDDDLAALVPSALGSGAPSAATGTSSSTRPSPKASGKFVTDGGRIAAPKIVKRSTKSERTDPSKRSGAYLKAITTTTSERERGSSAKASTAREPSAKLEDFSDLVAEIEALGDEPQEERTVLIPRDEVQIRAAKAPSAHSADVDVEASITEAVQAALPKIATVPLSLATIAAAVPASHRSAASVGGPPVTTALAGVLPLPAATPVLQARSPEHLANVHAPAVTAEAAEPRAPATTTATPAKRRRSALAKAMIAIAVVGGVAAGAWVAGGAWAARHHRVAPEVVTTAVAPPAPEPSAIGTAEQPAPPATEPSAVAQAPVVATEPQGSPQPAIERPNTSATSTPVATTAKPAAARPPAGPTAESAVVATTAEPPKETRTSSKPSRRTRSKGSDDAKANGETRDEVDEETKKALEALQRSQLESSF